jgi:hypothetical protein
VNDLAFVERVQAELRAHDVATWIFGGWGEELRALSPPRAHGDVDLLYPGESWAAVDALAYWFIGAKRFPWKRAFMLDDVMVELFLVQRDAGGWFTRLAHRRHDWPCDVFAEGGVRPVASTAALRSYREAHAAA